MSNTAKCESIINMMDKMPNGVAFQDADTILQDIFDEMEPEVTGVAKELITVYLNATNRKDIEKAFLIMTGVTWNSFIDKAYTAMSEAITAPQVGEWKDVQIEELYVPDKRFTTYHTKQTCSACGVRTAFVGEAPFINDNYCPVCGKSMKTTNKK